LSAEEVRSRLGRLLRPASVPALESVRARLRSRAERMRSGEPAFPSGLERDPVSRVLARSSAFAADHAHGDWRLAEVRGADAPTLALLANDPALAGIDLEDALYLDTETSGLAGGSGTWVFLVGLGRFRGGAFEVWQGFLAEPADERELLAEAAARIRAAPCLVTFFGKAFDRHRLEDKMRIHGIERPFPGRPHLDLYHPLRRLYGAALPDARLKTVERALCGVEREDDLPGSRAPAAWFDFLHGRPHELAGVFRHNERDVLSLVTLAAHLARTLAETRADGSILSGPAGIRALSVARSFAGARRSAAAVEWFARAIERGTPPRTAAEELLCARARRRALRDSARSARQPAC
jgi:uncharacterized protein YprB with RNaseH-like and TPR domain